MCEDIKVKDERWLLGEGFSWGTGFVSGLQSYSLGAPQDSSPRSGAGKDGLLPHRSFTVTNASEDVLIQDLCV